MAWRKKNEDQEGQDRGDNAEFEKRKTPSCIYCEETQNLEHTIFYCQRWRTAREVVQDNIGHKLTVGNLIGSMLRSEQDWDAIAAMITDLLQQK